MRMKRKEEEVEGEHKDRWIMKGSTHYRSGKAGDGGEAARFHGRITKETER